MEPWCECPEEWPGQCRCIPHDGEWVVECEPAGERRQWIEVDRAFTLEGGMDLLSLNAADPGDDWMALRLRDERSGDVKVTVDLRTLGFIRSVLGG